MAEVYIEGKTFDCKDQIKGITRLERRVFQWDPASKSWRARVHDDEIDGLAEEVAGKCAGCALRVVV